MPTLSTLKFSSHCFFNELFLQISILIYKFNPFYDILYLSSIIYFKSYHLKLFHASMGIVHQLFVYSTIVFQKYNTFSYEMMIVFHKTLFWNVVVWRMIEMKHFSFFFSIKLSKRINWWKIYFSRGNNFHHFRKRSTQNIA